MIHFAHFLGVYDVHFVLEITVWMKNSRRCARIGDVDGAQLWLPLRSVHWGLLTSGVCGCSGRKSCHMARPVLCRAGCGFPRIPWIDIGCTSRHAGARFGVGLGCFYVKFCLCVNSCEANLSLFRVG